MTTTHFSLTAAATVILSSTLLFAQSAPTDAAPSKPSPYQGVSVPPASDAITTSEEAPASPPAVTRPAPAPVLAPPAPRNPDAGIIETPLPPSADEYTPHSRAGLNTR